MFIKNQYFAQIKKNIFIFNFSFCVLFYISIFVLVLVFIIYNICINISYYISITIIYLKKLNLKKKEINVYVL